MPTQLVGFKVPDNISQSLQSQPQIWNNEGLGSMSNPISIQQYLNRNKGVDLLFPYSRISSLSTWHPCPCTIEDDPTPLQVADRVCGVEIPPVRSSVLLEC